MLNKFNRVMDIVLEDIDPKTLKRWKNKTNAAKENISEKITLSEIIIETAFKKIKDKI